MVPTRRITLASLLSAAMLVACGGGGSSDSTPRDDSPKILFVPDQRTGTIGALSTLAPAAGSNLLVDSFRPKDGGGFGGNVQYDAARDELYSGWQTHTPADQAGVAVYGSASKGSAGLTLTRILKLPNDVRRQTEWLVLDRVTDTLYVHASRVYDDELMVYKNASTLSGTVLPDQSFVFKNHMSQPAFDFKRGIFYTGYLRFNLSTGVAIAGLPYLPEAGEGVAVDSDRDVLYLANSRDNTVRIISQASTADAAIVATLQIQNAEHVTIDPENNRLYVSANQTEYVFEGASTIRGSAANGSAVSVAGAWLGGVAFR
jgi:hypothetical protein